MTKNVLFKKNAAAFLFAFCCVALQITNLRAQQPPWVPTNQPALSEPQLLPDRFESNDSLNEVVNELVPTDSLQEPKVSFANVDVPTYEDSIYRTRLNAIVTPVILTYNDEVKKYIDLYVLNRREQVARMLGLSKIYFPIFDQIFAQYGIPQELKYLSIIESALNPHAVSRVGATGMWQFMYGTAKQYGLNINSYVDERKDLIRSTEGAAQYLKAMYEVYGDWLLAVASYNCGPGNVNRAISLSGGKTFWEIRDKLPRETRNYVPAFIAATYVMNYYDLHDLSPEYPKYSFEPITTVDISDKMACDQIAKFTGLSMEEFKFLNPGLKCSVIPGGSVYSYACKLPSDRISIFDQNRDSIVLLSINAKTIYYSGYSPGATITYTVRKGDNLGKIAQKYHVSVSQIKKWNRLHSSTIRVGQKLKITTRGSTSTATASAPEKKPLTTPGTKPEAAPVVSQDIQNTTDTLTPVAVASAEKVTYTVRKGDNIGKIAAANNVTASQIMEWNKLSTSTIRVGQRLKLYSPVSPATAAGMPTENSNTASLPVTEKMSTSSTSASVNAAGEKITYTVQKGDYLSKIAEKHHVTVSQIKEWNDMASSTVLLGQKLKIYSTNTSAIAAVSEKKVVAPGNSSTATSVPATKAMVIPGKSSSGNYVYYKARNGDTLWDIAQRHGITVAEIRKLNGPSKCNNLKAGTVLKLSSKG